MVNNVAPVLLFFSLQIKLSVQESTLNRLQTSLRDSEEEVRSLKNTVEQQRDELHAGEMERRRLHNTIQELKVIRPLMAQKIWVRLVFSEVINQVELFAPVNLKSNLQ